MYRIIPRPEWGAQHDAGAGPAPLPARWVFLHHSVTIAPDLLPPFDDDYDAVRALERIGESRFGRGISYTFVISPAGLIFEGHGIARRGAHTSGYNTTGRAICFIGNYETDHPTDAQIDAAGWLLAHGFLNGWWDASPMLDGGHRDVKGTACPGRHAYAAIGAINARARAHLDGIDQLPPQPDPTPAPTTPRPTGDSYAMDRLDLRKVTSTPSTWVRGRHVDNAQGLLAAFARTLPDPACDPGDIDGVAGPATRRAVHRFQEVAKFLGSYTGAVDDDLGPATWRALIEA